MSTNTNNDDDFEPATCARCEKPFRLIEPKDMPRQTLELYGLEALKKISQMCFGFIPMNDDEKDYRIHHCVIDMYFRNFAIGD